MIPKNFISIKDQYIKNEMYMDSFFHKNLLSKRNIQIFRPYKFLNRSKLVKYFYYKFISYKVLSFFTVFILILFSYIKSLFKKRLLIVNSNNILFVHSEKCVLLYNSIHPGSNYLTVNLSKNNSFGTHTSQYLDNLTLFILFIFCVKLIIKSYRNCSVYIINHYDIYDTICFAQLLSNQNSNKKINFFITSHYDRWSYLLSCYSNSNSNIIQHGFLSQNLNIPYKLSHINTIYITNNKFIDDFNMYIKKVNEYILFTYKLKFKHFKFNNKNTIILVISSVHNFKHEEDLLHRLSLGGNYNLIYKLHPVYMNLNNNLPDSVIIVDKSYIFPTCDLVLHSGSYLAYEYFSNGIKISHLKDFN